MLYNVILTPVNVHKSVERVMSSNDMKFLTMKIKKKTSQQEQQQHILTHERESDSYFVTSAAEISHEQIHIKSIIKCIQ